MILLAAVVVAGVLVQLGGEVVRMVHTQMQVDMAQRVVYRLREQLLHHLQALPLRHHVASRTADAVYRLDADAYCVDDLVIGGVFPLTVAAMNLSLMFGVLVYLDTTLALLSLTVAPFLYLCLRHHARTMTDQAERVKTLESGLIERILDVLSSIAAVKSFTRERYELERFSDAGRPDPARPARSDLAGVPFLRHRHRGDARRHRARARGRRPPRPRRPADGGQPARRRSPISPRCIPRSRRSPGPPARCSRRW